jgi:hypothetical protein
MTAEQIYDQRFAQLINLHPRYQKIVNSRLIKGAPNGRYWSTYLWLVLEHVPRQMASKCL